MPDELTPRMRPDLYGELAATDAHQSRARRLFGRGRVLAVHGNQAEVEVGRGSDGSALVLKQVPIVSGYVPRVGDWVAIQYEGGHSGAPWVTGPSMAADQSEDSSGVGVFPVLPSEPADPQVSTVYFDDTQGTWRGWNGETWVDLPAGLHNAFPDLQGGQSGEYYHFGQAAHSALHDLYDGDGMASAWVKRLRFTAIDASGTTRSRFFEQNGDLFMAINAEYDEAQDEWNRIDTSKYAYVIGLYSANGIPHEPGELSGISWWRAVSGENPIGDYTAVGGWELGFMMTEHRNYVMGGMNLEIDGAGSPPYGRLSQSGSEDVSATVFTGVQRNSWYEGEGSWGRDTDTENSAIIGFDADADLFAWWYPDSSEGSAPWNTADWQERVHLHLGADGIRGRLDLLRSSPVTDEVSSAFLSKHITSGDMADGFGAGYALAIEDSAGVEQIIGALYAVRDGADDTGLLRFSVASGGTLGNQMELSAAGALSLTGGLTLNGHIYMTGYTVDQPAYVDIQPGCGHGIRFWNSDSYKIHMGNEAEYQYGPVTDYSIKTNMSSTSGRGWTWGVSGATPVAAISNVGDMKIAGDLDIANVRLADDTALKITTGSGWITVGPKNTAWCHFYTDRGKFWFQKGLTVDTGLISSYNENLQLQRAATTMLTLLDGAIKADSQYYSDLHNNGNSGSSQTINWNNGNVQKLTLTANCTITLSNPKNGGRYLLILVQDATGGRSVTWPSSVKWPGGTAPTLSGASKVDVITLVYDGSYYRGGASLEY